MTDAGVVAEHGAVDLSRRKFLTVATSATAAVGALVATVPFVASWKPSERARAMGAPYEFDLTRLQPGQLVTVIWRKQPIYIVRRPQAIVDKLATHDANLKDPQSADSEQPEYARNEMRSRQADLLVLVGTCTHLGCLPKSRFEPGDATLGTDWPGGFFCPCHGSRFDFAGRVFADSPASTNLSVPPYVVAGDKLLIGQDSVEGAA